MSYVSVQCVYCESWFNSVLTKCPVCDGKGLSEKQRFQQALSSASQAVLQAKVELKEASAKYSTAVNTYNELVLKVSKL